MEPEIRQVCPIGAVSLVELVVRELRGWLVAAGRLMRVGVRDCVCVCLSGAALLWNTFGVEYLWPCANHYRGRQSLLEFRCVAGGQIWDYLGGGDVTVPLNRY